MADPVFDPQPRECPGCGASPMRYGGLCAECREARDAWLDDHADDFNDLWRDEPPQDRLRIS